MRTFTGRLVIAWVVTIALLLVSAWIAQTPTGNDWIMRSLFFAGIPYIILMTRWVFRG